MPTAESQLPSRAAGLKAKAKIYLPWLFCAVIFYYLFKQVPLKKVWAALQIADKGSLFYYGLVYFLTVFVADCLALKHFISRFATPVSVKEMFIVRGATYLMMILNYTASQGALAVYLKKTHRASVAKTLGTLFFTSLADVLLVFTSALIALSYSSVHYEGIDLQSVAFKTVPLLYLGFLVWILFWKNTHRHAMRHLRQFRIVNWLLAHDIFHIFREATWQDYLVLFLYRTPLLIVIIGSINFSVIPFSARIDWMSIYLYNPIIMFLTSLPITPGGLGAGQLLTLHFFKDAIQSPLFSQGVSTPKEILLTASLMWYLINQFYKAIFGTVCLSLSSREFFKE